MTKCLDKFCFYCDKNTIHDLFVDPFQRNSKNTVTQRVFAGLATLGLSELSSGNRKAKCRGCDTVTLVNQTSAPKLPSSTNEASFYDLSCKTYGHAWFQDFGMSEEMCMRCGCGRDEWKNYPKKMPQSILDALNVNGR